MICASEHPLPRPAAFVIEDANDPVILQCACDMCASTVTLFDPNVDARVKTIPAPHRPAET